MENNLSPEEIISIMRLSIGARMFNEEQTNAYEQGLAILENAPSARSFVSDSRKFKDYHRRTRQMIAYLTSYGTHYYAAEGSKQSRRPGRPTKEEQAQMVAEKKEQALKEARESLFPEVKPNVAIQPLTYNGIVANPNGDSIAATMPTLNQIKVFLTPALQERVNTVRDLRCEMASKAEEAKTMAEANEKAIAQNKGAIYTEAEIAELATRAVEIESDILPEIFIAVDREMGECYLRLNPKTGDPEYISYIEKNMNISPNDLRTQFKPFYEKAQQRDPRFADQVTEKIANDRPEVKAEREKQAQHKAEADKMIKYIMRKDKSATAARVKGLKERIETLRKDYSDVVDEEELKGYEAILAKTEEEVKHGKK